MYLFRRYRQRKPDRTKTPRQAPDEPIIKASDGCEVVEGDGDGVGVGVGKDGEIVALVQFAWHPLDTRQL